jgi:hypothetical protein
MLLNIDKLDNERLNKKIEGSWHYNVTSTMVSNRKKIQIFPNAKRTFLKAKGTRCWWLTPKILATQEAEIRRITI